MTSDIMHLFMCLLAICVSMGKCLLRTSRSLQQREGLQGRHQGPCSAPTQPLWYLSPLGPPVWMYQCLCCPQEHACSQQAYRGQFSRQEAQGETPSQEEAVDSKCCPRNGILEKKGTHIRCLPPAGLCAPRQLFPTAVRQPSSPSDPTSPALSTMPLPPIFL